MTPALHDRVIGGVASASGAEGFVRKIKRKNR
jgi:hypothetical protein